MRAYALLQTLILGLVLWLSLFYAWRKALPAASGRVLARLAARFERPGRAAVWRRLGRWLAPSPAAACDSGCSACDGCGGAEPPRQEAPLVFQRRPR